MSLLRLHFEASSGCEEAAHIHTRMCQPYITANQMQKTSPLQSIDPQWIGFVNADLLPEVISPVWTLLFMYQRTIFAQAGKIEDYTPEDVKDVKNWVVTNIRD